MIRSQRLFANGTSTVVEPVGLQGSSEFTYGLTFDATVSAGSAQIQWSFDKVNWVDFGAGKTASEGGLISRFPFFRFVLTAYAGSGNVTLFIRG